MSFRLLVTIASLLSSVKALTVCPQPVLSTPTAFSVSSNNRIPITGTYTPTAPCDVVVIYINDVYFDQIQTTSDNPSFSTYYLAPSEGPYLISVRGRSGDGSVSDSIPQPGDDHKVTVSNDPCPIPTISSPAPLTSQTSKILDIQGSISGRGDCRSIDVYVDNVKVQNVPIDFNKGVSFATTYTVPSDGNHEVYLVSVSNIRPGLASLHSDLRTVNVYTPAPVSPFCPDAVLLPYIGQTTEPISPYILVQSNKAARADCAKADFYVDGVNVGPASMNGDYGFFASYTVKTPGPHEVYVLYRSSVDPKYDSPVATADRRTVIVTTTKCPTPIITSPLDASAQNGDSLVVTGTVPGPSGPGTPCRAVLVTIDGNTRGTGILADGTFSLTQAMSKEGSHSISAQTSHSEYYLLYSPEAKVTTRSYKTPCPAPILVSPKAGETSTTEVFFSGEVDNRPECGRIEVYVDGKLVYSTSTASATSRRKRELVPFSFAVSTRDLSPGPHNIYAVSTGDNNGLKTETIPIVIANQGGPMPTGNISKRKNRCGAEQILCPFKMSGRIGFECIDDVTSNLERCGACDGPDCTEIANASDVACVQSQCIVSQCMEGYVLRDNQCIMEVTSLILQE